MRLFLVLVLLLWFFSVKYNKKVISHKQKHTVIDTNRAYNGDGGATNTIIINSMASTMNN